jgi:polysaccharide biosynthesis protein PslH
MKILQLTNKIPYPPKDGGAIATLNLSKGLARLGNTVDILGMNTSKHFVELSELPVDLTSLVTIHEVRIDTQISLKAAFKNLLFSHKPYNAERFFSEDFTRALIELLKQNQYDIVQLEGLYMAYYIPIVRKYSNSKIALRAHNIEHEIWERNAGQEKTWWKRWYFQVLARRIRKFKISIMNKYDLLIPITERDASQFEAFGNKKPMHVVPAGFDMSLLNIQPELIEFPSVFFIGTLDWFPNQEGVIWFLDKIWPRLHEKHPDLVFNIAGRNAPEWIIQRFMDAAGVNFMGEIDDAYAFINKNAIMVAPLFSGSGMRVKIIEGMALGKTIITTSIGAEGINVTSGKNIIIEDDDNQFLLRLDELLKDRNLLDSIGVNAHSFVEQNYDNHRISVSLAHFYQKHL